MLRKQQRVLEKRGEQTIHSCEKAEAEKGL